MPEAYCDVFAHPGPKSVGREVPRAVFHSQALGVQHSEASLVLPLPREVSIETGFALVRQRTNVDPARHDFKISRADLDIGFGINGQAVRSIVRINGQAVRIGSFVTTLQGKLAGHAFRGAASPQFVD
jgi:hypothetical protein